MAEENQNSNEFQSQAPVHAVEEAAVGSKDRGILDFLGKKEEEKPKEEEVIIANEFGEKVQVSEHEPNIEKEKKEEKEKQPSILDKLHRSDSSSSSSSDEEEDEEKKKKKKEKKGLKEKIKEKIPGEKEEVTQPEAAASEPDEKKGFLGMIKEKLPGQKKTDEVQSPPPHPADSASTEAHYEGSEAKEKKGIFEKIKEKLPGYHPKAEEDK